MKRKYLYSLLALPILVLVVYLLVIPGDTRATFIAEFKHRTAQLFGYETEPVTGSDGTQGLRSERPEEYGPQPGGESGDDDGRSADESTETAEDSGAESAE